MWQREERFPLFHHSKRKACRVHINKQETHDPSLFLKVRRTGNSAATKFAISIDYLYGAPSLEDARDVLYEPQYALKR